MWDGVKGRIPEKYRNQIEEKAELFSKINPDTGEMIGTQKSDAKRYHGLVHELGKRIHISGSLCKAYNHLSGRGLHNIFDLNYFEVRKILIQYQNDYAVPLEEIKIETIEFGVNQMVEFDILDVLRMFKSYKFHSAIGFRKYQNGGWYKQFAIAERLLKLYDKRGHFESQYIFPELLNLLRIELKLRTNKESRKILGVQNFADLLNKDAWKRGIEFILNELDKEVFIYETNAPFPEMTNREARIFQTGRDEDLRVELLGDGITGAKRRRRFKDQLNKIFEKYDLNDFKNKLLNDVRMKLNLMLSDEYLPEFEITEISKNGYKIHTLSRNENQAEKPKPGIKSTHSLYGFYTQNGFCRITGIEISHQRKDSKYLSEKTVLEMMQVGDSRVTELREKYLANWSEAMTDEKTAYLIAHNIRNITGNRKRDIRHRVEIYSNSLFPFEADDGNLSE